RRRSLSLPARFADPRRPTTVVVGCLWAALAGCGGGASLPTPPVQATINWAARSRSIDAPSSALSVVLVLTKASPDGTDFKWTINRDTIPAGYAITYTSTNKAVVGTYPFTVSFYSQAGGGGSVVASASTTVT